VTYSVIQVFLKLDSTALLLNFFNKNELDIKKIGRQEENNFLSARKKLIVIYNRKR